MSEAANVAIRRMTLADAEAVHAIETDAFAMPWSLQSFVREMTANPCARYLVAEADGQILGYAGAWIVLDEGHVTNIAIRRDARCCGLGSRLMAALMQYASNLGVSYMTLEVRKSNEAARRLYESLGFIELGVRKRYYEDNGEDALLMVCQRMPDVEDGFEE